MILTVKVRNSFYDKRHLYAQGLFNEYDYYTGELLPSSKWDGDHAFRLKDLFTGFERVIQKELAECGWKH
jgi:hypothetical protein